MTALGPNVFYSAKLRISRAKEHIDDLESKIAEFFAKNPYRRVTEPDPDGVHEIYKIEFTERFPLRWKILATEIIEHLRASLDHATWASAYLATKNPDLKFGIFPFSDNAINLENRMKGWSKDCPPEILAVLRLFKPYDGGNELLCALNDLCNLSKHALLTFVAGATGQAEVAGIGLDGPIQFCEPLIWDGVKNEIKYARVKRGTNFDHDFEFEPYVALQHRERTYSQPAIDIFNMMRTEVSAVVLTIENECRRIKLIP